MGVNGRGAGEVTDFERGHLELSFKRSLVALTAAIAISMFVASPLWVVAVYGIAFWFGRRAGFAVKRGTDGRVERPALRVVAWHDPRPALVIVAPLALFVFLAAGMKVFTVWLQVRGDTALLADEALAGLSEAFAASSSWGQPWTAIVVLMAGSLVVASGLTDGFWVGAVQSRTGQRLRRTIPFGADWAEWRRERSERRKVYLGGAG